MIAAERPLDDAVTGFGFALVACGGIAAERLSRGDVEIAFLAHLLLTVVALAVMMTEPSTSSAQRGLARIGAQFIGAVAGIVVAHALLKPFVTGLPWLSERPAQFVNDAVAVFASLAIVWAASRRPPRTAVLVAALVLVTLYRATGTFWHLDAARFAWSVQNFVTGEVAGLALGVAAFRFMAPV